MKPIKIENWCVVNHQADNYKAPEQTVICLHGTAINHPARPDKPRWKCRTSAIIDVDGKTVHTKSGSIYELGKPDKEYLLWMRENGIEYNSENPIKIIEADKLLKGDIV